MRLDRRWRLAAVAGLLVALAAPAAAQDGRVMGRVTDGAGNPVEGSAVSLEALEAGSEARTTVTGPTGGFQFDAVPPGEYTLRIARDGYAPRAQRLAVRPGTVATKVIRLARAPG